MWSLWSKERVLETLCLKLRAPQFYPDPLAWLTSFNPTPSPVIRPALPVCHCDDPDGILQLRMEDDVWETSQDIVPKLGCLVWCPKLRVLLNPSDGSLDRSL